MIVLAGNWWAFVLRGVLAILFGLMAVLVPGMAFLTLVYLFGFYATGEGILNLIAAFRRTAGAQQPWWALLVEGILSVIAGLAALFLPGLTGLILLYIIAGWAVATGIMEIIAAIRLRRQIRNEWLLGLAGALSIVFGVLVAMFPGAGALAVVLWIGAYAIVFGALLIALGIRIHQVTRPERPLRGYPGVAPGR